MRLKHRALWVVLLLVSTAAGCRQADGPMPVREGEVPNRLEDIKRDLISAAAGDRDAIGDLGDDLSVFAERQGNEAARQLAQRVGVAVSGSQLTDEAADKLA